ncbi:unnamed protein product [Cylicocyclus nassatus]|uniref:Uncharacterized protein n=1 Tax=Cylicocyclus nassatus TaxID=53992 RepID=A0AA36H6B6_CYLNA|nr:unnamed protein product [Cylicocyclus nassatus]
MYLYAPPLESINPNISKIDYAIEWNMRESCKGYFAMPCSEDWDTQSYTKYYKEPEMRCVAVKFTEATRKVVQHEEPDIVLYMHHSLETPFVAPVKDLSKDRIYKEFQGNIDFISNYTKHIVIEMPYYTPPFNVGAKLARRLQLGLSPGDEFVVTWEQHINQTRYHQLRLSSLNCSKCIMNKINEVRKVTG